MTEPKTIAVKVDLITMSKDGSFNLVLNEEGPWEENEVEVHLRQLGQRICDCVTAIVSGQFAKIDNRSVGKAFTIRIQSFETPRDQVERLVESLRAQFDANPDIQSKLGQDQSASSITLAHDWVDWATVIAHS